jgi:hypothetical protein
VFENRVLRRIFGPKFTGKTIKLHALHFVSGKLLFLSKRGQGNSRSLDLRCWTISADSQTLSNLVLTRYFVLGNEKMKYKSTEWKYFKHFSHLLSLFMRQLVVNWELLQLLLFSQSLITRSEMNRRISALKREFKISAFLASATSRLTSKWRCPRISL